MLCDWAFVQNSHIDDAESEDSESEEGSLPSLRGDQVDGSDDDDSSIESSSEEVRFHEDSMNISANGDTQVESNQVKFDTQKREVLHDASKLKNHAYNQSSTKCRSSKDRLWE